LFIGGHIDVSELVEDNMELLRLLWLPDLKHGQRSSAEFDFDGGVLSHERDDGGEPIHRQVPLNEEHQLAAEGFHLNDISHSLLTTEQQLSALLEADDFLEGKLDNLDKLVLLRLVFFDVALAQTNQVV